MKIYCKKCGAELKVEDHLVSPCEVCVGVLVREAHDKGQAVAYRHATSLLEGFSLAKSKSMVLGDGSLEGQND